jgi:hypothetical protein
LAYFTRCEELFELRLAVRVSVSSGGSSLEGGGGLGKLRLAFAGISSARSGMWRSPITRTRREVILRIVRCWKTLKAVLAEMGSFPAAVTQCWSLAGIAGPARASRNLQFRETSGEAAQIVTRCG